MIINPLYRKNNVVAAKRQPITRMPINNKIEFILEIFIYLNKLEKVIQFCRYNFLITQMPH
jgi:hypothetical protein